MNMNFATDNYFNRALGFACKIDEVKFFQLKLHTDKMKKFYVKYSSVNYRSKKNNIA